MRSLEQLCDVIARIGWTQFWQVSVLALLADQREAEKTSVRQIRRFHRSDDEGLEKRRFGAQRCRCERERGSKKAHG